jgi:hypothetical protein
MGVPEIEAFLTHLTKQENVAASTQNQAFSSLLFLYRHVTYNLKIVSMPCEPEIPVACQPL